MSPGSDARSGWLAGGLRQEQLAAMEILLYDRVIRPVVATPGASSQSSVASTVPAEVHRIAPAVRVCKQLMLWFGVARPLLILDILQAAAAAPHILA